MLGPHEGPLGPDETLQVDQLARYTIIQLLEAIEATDNVGIALGRAEDEELQGLADTMTVVQASLRNSLGTISVAWSAAGDPRH